MDAQQVAKAIAAADWSGVSIGNKAILCKAVELLAAPLANPSDTQEAALAERRIGYMAGVKAEREHCAALAQSAEQDRIDAERYRFLRDKMRFSSPPGDIPTMTLSAPLEAPTHDTHKDWISDRFDASVDRTIDAAMEREND
jgi:hypothetical protein